MKAKDGNNIRRAGPNGDFIRRHNTSFSKSTEIFVTFAKET